MFSNWAFILIGNNNTGKTTFQKQVVHTLCNANYDRLPRNFHGNIVHPRSPRQLETLFAMNRSLQEMQSSYKSVNDFFNRGFNPAEICLLSSHADAGSFSDVQQMIEELHIRCYNVASIFFSNGYDESVHDFAKLNWQERLWVENPVQKDNLTAEKQLQKSADAFSEMLIVRAISF